MQNFLHAVGEFITPTLTQSQFLQKGVLTPEEFVLAGDLLVTKYPTWQWTSGEASKVRSILPPNKQCLVTRGVPCTKRAKSFFTEQSERTVEKNDGMDDEGWALTEGIDGKDGGNKKNDIDEIPDISISNNNNNTNNNNNNNNNNDDDDGEIPEITDFDDEDGKVIEDNDASTLSSNINNNNSSDDNVSGVDNIQKTRKYDITITYDKYYQTPRVWLFGYDENGNPLTKKQIFEDISQEHAEKTCTVETHPHFNAEFASIHPCRHAMMMKRLLDRQVENGKKVEVDQYLLYFLKFVSSVIPSIEYDYTASAE